MNERQKHIAKWFADIQKLKAGFLGKTLHI